MYRGRVEDYFFMRTVTCHLKCLTFLIVLVIFKWHLLKLILRNKNGWLWQYTHHYLSIRTYFMTELTKILDKYRGSYENIVILGIFNMQPTNQILETFLEDNCFVNLIKSNTCFKSKPGSCIDLIVKN